MWYRDRWESKAGGILGGLRVSVEVIEYIECRDFFGVCFFFV